MTPDPNHGPAPDSAPPADAERPGTTLPLPIQEHLAQQLRATYQEIADKPAFLGDAALPPRFEHHIQEIEKRERAESREKAHNAGVEAVEAALQEVASGTTGPEEPAAPAPAPSKER
jgi:hypothetical protein